MTKMMGVSHHFFRIFKNVQNSLKIENLLIAPNLFSKIDFHRILYHAEHDPSSTSRGLSF